MEHIWIRLGKGYVFGMYVKKKWNKNRFPRKLNYTISTRKRPLFTKWIDNVYFYFFFLWKIRRNPLQFTLSSWLFNWYAYFEFGYLKAINFVGFSIWIAASLNGTSKGYFRFQLVGLYQSVFFAITLESNWTLQKESWSYGAVKSFKKPF